MSMYDACRFAPSTTTEDLAKLREAARVLAAAIAAVKRR
jgi:hypothetical protein